LTHCREDEQLGDIDVWRDVLSLSSEMSMGYSLSPGAEVTQLATSSRRRDMNPDADDDIGSQLHVLSLTRLGAHRMDALIDWQ